VGRLVPEPLARLGNRAGLLAALVRSRKRSRTSECCRRFCAEGQALVTASQQTRAIGRQREEIMPNSRSSGKETSISDLPLARRVYRLHTAFVRKVNDVHIFTMQSIPLLEEARNTYEASSHKKDRRYYVPSVGRTKFARRRDQELKEIYGRFISRELYENFIVSAVSQFESTLFEVLRLVIIAYPKKLTLNIQGVQTDRNVPLEVLLQSSSLDGALAEVIRRRINSISYASPQAYLEYLNRIAGITITDPSFHDYLEIKATRDLIIHNAGIINDIYIQKSGNKARGAIGERLTIDARYFNNCIATLKRVSGIVQRDVGKNFPFSENGT